MNEAPSIVVDYSTDPVVENAAKGTIVAEFSCENDPEIDICGGCEHMTYECSLNTEHTQFGSLNCGDFLRAFKITRNKMKVADERLLDFENIVSTIGDNTLPITVKITDDGHGNCVNVKGGPMASAMTTFYLTIADINERPTSVEFRCTEDMVALGPFDGCVSDTYELNLTNLRVGHILGEFHATDPDASDSLRYELHKSSWTSRNFYLDDGNKLRVKSVDFQGTESNYQYSVFCS